MMTFRRAGQTTYNQINTFMAVHFSKMFFFFFNSTKTITSMEIDTFQRIIGYS